MVHTHQIPLNTWFKEIIIFFGYLDVTVGLAAQHIFAVESEGTVEICVHISAEIARPLAFTITTVDRTATSE